MSRPFHVLIDGRMLLGRYSGVARMVTSLADHLCALSTMQVTILCGDEAYPPWIGRSDRRLLVTDFSRRHRSPWARFWWEETRLRSWIQASRCDVYHATWNYGIPQTCPVPVVLTIHDLIPWDARIVGPGTWVQRWAYRMAMRQAARRADRIVTVSRFTASQLLSRLPMDSSKFRVIHNGSGIPASHAAQDRPKSNPYFLYVGGHEPRKNLEAIFAAMAAFWSSNGQMQLRLTGSFESLSPDARDAYLQLPHKDRIKFLSAPDDVELAGHYAGAAALLMLTRAEGFGLPVIEAMRHGCPVIAARSGSLPEVVGDAGLLVDPDRTGQVVEAMVRSLDPVVADDLRTRGLRRASELTWEKAANEYLREYQMALSSADRKVNCPAPTICVPASNLPT